MEFLERLNQEIQRVQTSARPSLSRAFSVLSDGYGAGSYLKMSGGPPEGSGREASKPCPEFSGQTLFEGTSFKTSEMAVNIADISWTGVDTATFLLTNGTYLLGLTESPLSIHVVAQTIAGFVREARSRKTGRFAEARSG